MLLAESYRLQAGVYTVKWFIKVEIIICSSLTDASLSLHNRVSCECISLVSNSCVSSSKAEPNAISKNLKYSFSLLRELPSAIFDGMEIAERIICERRMELEAFLKPRRHEGTKKHKELEP
jgi:hypothetical protein